jgi:hypothetical protein
MLRLEAKLSNGYKCSQVIEITFDIFMLAEMSYQHYTTFCLISNEDDAFEIPNLRSIIQSSIPAGVMNKLITVL